MNKSFLWAIRRVYGHEGFCLVIQFEIHVAAFLLSTVPSTIGGSAFLVSRIFRLQSEDPHFLSLMFCLQSEYLGYYILSSVNVIFIRQGLKKWSQMHVSRTIPIKKNFSQGIWTKVGSCYWLQNTWHLTMLFLWFFLIQFNL